jgi:hypothetical protein
VLADSRGPALRSRHSRVPAERVEPGLDAPVSKLETIPKQPVWANQPRAAANSRAPRRSRRRIGPKPVELNGHLEEGQIGSQTEGTRTGQHRTPTLAKTRVLRHLWIHHCQRYFAFWSSPRLAPWRLAEATNDCREERTGGLPPGSTSRRQTPKLACPAQAQPRGGNGRKLDGPGTTALVLWSATRLRAVGIPGRRGTQKVSTI